MAKVKEESKVERYKDWADDRIAARLKELANKADVTPEEREIQMQLQAEQARRQNGIVIQSNVKKVVGIAAVVVTVGIIIIALVSGNPSDINTIKLM